MRKFKRPGMRRVRRKVGARRYGRYGIRARLTRAFNPMPSFVETYKSDGVITLSPGGSVGVAFKVRITDIPQVNQYAALYKQYRINWAKVMLIPKIDTAGVDPNAANYNVSAALPWWGTARIVHAINDSPNIAAPASEQEVLECNGAKIKAFRSKWSCSFRPVPDLAMTNTATGGQVATRQKMRSWLNFDTTSTVNNPEHGAVSAYITIPGNAGVGDPFQQVYYIYYKLGFSLRDPK